MPALVAAYPDAIYIHLRRKKEEVVNSWVRRGATRGPGRWATMARLGLHPFRRVCELNYEVTTQNIDAFSGKCNLHTYWLHEMYDRWAEFWNLIDAQPKTDREFKASQAEWCRKYNGIADRL
jgi:hypothetical protein